MEEYINFKSNSPELIWNKAGHIIRELNFPELWEYNYQKDCIGYVIFYMNGLTYSFRIDHHMFKCSFANISLEIPCKEFTVDVLLNTLKAIIDTKLLIDMYDALEKFIRERQYLAKCSDFQEQYNN